MEDEIEKTTIIATDKARSGVTGHHVRYVLVASLVLAIIVMIIVATAPSFLK
jgi:hypothetical protein